MKLISHSSRLTWNQCHKKYYWSQVKRLEPKMPAYALSRGWAAHRVIDEWIRAGRSAEKAEQIIEKVRPVYPELAAGLVEYTREFAPGRDQAQHVRYAESFAIELSDDWWYVGENDGLSRWDNRLWVIERKTTSQIPSDLVARFQLDDQTRGYVWQYKERGFDVAGVQVEIVRVTKNAQVVREWIPVSAYDLESFEDDLYLTIQELEDAAKHGRYPMSPHSCFAFGECPFRLLCLNPDRAGTPEEMGYNIKQLSHEQEVYARASGPDADAPVTWPGRDVQSVVLGDEQLTSLRLSGHR
jgi:hypothetical protein